eukprot:CAMPEP_0117426914 /NCGR_PEP_ID=MMETSP0758-20121206/6896_1 /TAXON_ID=63605 /ORGANISM="Percolomonas cosmopolitus, Strain AE-1 (ATCC 50343)" /LENGTH=178 /DNA_ID=CAMNT_0005212295 /DNA_START=546 /DNA_END=1079 /DNA_ORIENTATION=+
MTTTPHMDDVDLVIHQHKDQWMPLSMFGAFQKPSFMQHQLLLAIAIKLKPKKHKLRMDMELSCFAEDGIEAIQDVLRMATRFGDSLFQVTLLYSPRYMLTMMTNDITEGTHSIKSMGLAMKKALEEREGKCKLGPVRVVTERDEHTLSIFMTHIENQLKEIPADDDYEESMFKHPSHT